MRDKMDHCSSAGERMSWRVPGEGLVVEHGMTVDEVRILSVCWEGDRYIIAPARGMNQRILGLTKVRRIMGAR